MPGDRDPQDHRAAERRAMSPEEARLRKRRNLATGLALAAFAILILIVSLARLQSNIVTGAGA
jgi:ferric-dicitrate binding protein FerR (iron transport regulator)